MSYAGSHVPSVETRWRDVDVSSAISIAVGLCLTGAPVLLHLTTPVLAFAFTIAAGLIAARAAPGSVPVWILAAFTFQGLFVSLASPQFATAADLEQLKVYNTLLAASIWTGFAIKLLWNADVHGGLRRMVALTIACLVIVGLYGLAGVAFDLRGAAVYTRNIALPLVLFQIGLISAANGPCDLQHRIVLLLGIIAACGVVELLSPTAWLTLTNGWTYWDLAFSYEKEGNLWVKRALEGSPVITSILDLLKTDLFNAGWLYDKSISIQRLQGPNFHAISYGYALAILSVFSMALRYRALAAVVGVLLVFVSAKGPMIIFLANIILFASLRVVPRSVLYVGASVFAVFYLLAGLVIGQSTGDYHVLGFLGGVSGFLRWPIGHTLGQGGNLSTNFAGIDWNRFQFEGASDIAVESGLGVLLFQMGAAGLVLLTAYLWIALKCWHLYLRTGSRVAAASAFSIPLVLINSVFQEEALFSPLSLATLMLLTGVTLGSYFRRREQALGAAS